MPRFLVEIGHSNEHDGCARSLDAILKHGSHFVTNADFGCDDGLHRGWLIVEVDRREDAQQLIPPQFRVDAKVVQLRKWTQDQIMGMMEGLAG